MTARVSYETGGILPRFVTPSDVRDLKNRVDPYVVTTDASIAACATLPADVRTGWQAFSRAWRSFFSEEDSWLHTAAQMDQGEAYERDLGHWQDFLAKWQCAAAAPRIEPLDGNSGGASGASVAQTVRIVAIAGIAIAGVVALRTVLR